jgi:hypothetical protein
MPNFTHLLSELKHNKYAGFEPVTFSVVGEYSYHYAVYIYIPFSLYPRRVSRDISDIPPRRLNFTKIIWLWEILQTWQVVSPWPSNHSQSQVWVWIILKSPLRHPLNNGRSANYYGYEELDGSVVSVLRRAIAEVKHHWLVIEWRKFII